jgi:hypothetical protein
MAGEGRWGVKAGREIASHATEATMSAKVQVWLLALTVFWFAICAAFAQSNSGTTYWDPQRRFNVRVPAGWTAEALGESGAKVSRGSAYANVLVMEGGSKPADMLAQLARQIGAQWSNFAEVQRGDGTLSGHPAAFVFYSGVNPRGVPSFLKLVALATDQATYVLLMSAAQNEFTALKAALDQIEQSFTPGEASAAVTPAPNNPLLGSPPGGMGSNTGAGGAMPLPPEWNPPGQSGQPAPAPAINLVGRWTYQATEEGIPEEVLIIFQPNGQYNQFIRFPQTPALGNQIVQVWGQYVLPGSSLTSTPAGAQVSNGPNPQQLCNMQTQRCITPNVQPSTVQMQPIDANTVQTPQGIAKRIAP